MIFKTGSKILICTWLLLISLWGKATNISGKIQLNDAWQPVLFMASIIAHENLNVTSPDSKKFINPDGTFSFQKIILSTDPRFYRFYMIKSQNSFNFKFYFEKKTVNMFNIS